MILVYMINFYYLDDIRSNSKHFQMGSIWVDLESVTPIFWDKYLIYHNSLDELHLELLYLDGGC